jgi:four helix bundle protein
VPVVQLEQIIERQTMPLGKKDFIYRMRITRKEAKECQYWLQLIVEANPEFNNSAESFLKEAEELKRIFSSIIDKSQ